MSKCLSIPTLYAARPWTNHLSLFPVTAVPDSLWQWQLTSFMQHLSICHIEPSCGTFTHWFTFNCSWPHLAAFSGLSYYAGIKNAFQQFLFLASAWYFQEGPTAALTSNIYVSPIKPRETDSNISSAIKHTGKTQHVFCFNVRCWF